MARRRQTSDQRKQEILQFLHDMGRTPSGTSVNRSERGLYTSVTQYKCKSSRSYDPDFKRAYEELIAELGIQPPKKGRPATMVYEFIPDEEGSEYDN